MNMKNDELDDFFLDGGDELMNSEECPHCGAAIYLDQEIEWVDEARRTAKCPECGEEVKI